ncbi:MAG: histidinol dehydrogenase [bacterium]
MKNDFLPVETLSKLSASRRRTILRRSTTSQRDIQPLVERVVADVARNGDAALLKYTSKFDRVRLTQQALVVSPREIVAAYQTVYRQNPTLLGAIRSTIECVSGYHKGELAQMKRGLKGWETTVGSKKWGAAGSLKVGQIRTPLDSVGVYVPGGNAVLLTSAIMALTPAKVAKVPLTVVCSPPSRNGDIDPRIIVAADMSGADRIVRAGGAQAVAAMAYGTESVPRVAKIVGPGNVFVATAKSLVASAGACGIDFFAGPSEVLIIADEHTPVEYAARDMLSQSEHDPNASAVLVTTSVKVAKAVRSRIIAEFKGAGTSSIAQRALAGYGAILVAESLDAAVEFANEFAPEHLEIMTLNPRDLLRKVRNAGGIFLGRYTPVAVGDYVCPNHILPTGGAARFTSGISIDTFLKKPSFLEVPKKMVRKLDSLIETLSKAEGLYAQHGLSVHARAEEE